MFKKYDKLISGCFFLILSVVIFSQVPNIRFVDVALGPRIFPWITGILMSIIGVLLTIFGLLGLKETRKTPTPQFDKKAVVQIISSLAMLAIFAILMPLTGVIIAGAVYLTGSFLMIAPKKQWNIPVFLVLAIVFPIAVYFLFSEGFKMVLPSGTLWR
jgi:hypothetical protein